MATTVNLGSQSIGAIVKLNVAGTPKEFIVVNQGKPNSTHYDDTCDGTWLVMKELATMTAWGASVNTYTLSNVHSYLTNTFLYQLDANIQEALLTPNLPYINGTGSVTTLSYGDNGLPAKVFALSMAELGLSSSYVTVCGAQLSYFTSSTSRKAYNSAGTATAWFSRIPRKSSTTSVTGVSTSGTTSSNLSLTTSYGVRPALILPSDARVDSNGFVIPNIISGYATVSGTESKLTKGYVEDGGIWRNLFPIVYKFINGVWVPTGGDTGGGDTGGDNEGGDTGGDSGGGDEVTYTWKVYRINYVEKSKSVSGELAYISYADEYPTSEFYYSSTKDFNRGYYLSSTVKKTTFRDNPSSYTGYYFACSQYDGTLSTYLSNFNTNAVITFSGVSIDYPYAYMSSGTVYYSEQEKGEYLWDTTSTSPSEYPEDGNDGMYWYVKQ